VAAKLNAVPQIDVPAPLPPETRAPDSIQFNLVGLDDAAIRGFADASAKAGVKVQVFGQSTDNARAFWNWQFIQDLPDLPQTRAMLMTACDVRLPVQLQTADLDAIVNVLLGALASVTKSAAA
ncbi:MAG: DegT/DnrJ/EryC1/StrS family aminotransferase, partial [Rhodobacterales bacterium]